MCGSLGRGAIIPLPHQLMWQCLAVGSNFFTWRAEKHGAEELGSFSSPVQMNQVVKPGHPFAVVFPHRPLL